MPICACHPLKVDRLAWVHPGWLNKFMVCYDLLLNKKPERNKADLISNDYHLQLEQQPNCYPQELSLPFSHVKTINRSILAQK